MLFVVEMCPWTNGPLSSPLLYKKKWPNGIPLTFLGNNTSRVYKCFFISNLHEVCALATNSQCFIFYYFFFECISTFLSDRPILWKKTINKCAVEQVINAKELLLCIWIHIFIHPPSLRRYQWWRNDITHCIILGLSFGHNNCYDRCWSLR